MGWSCQDYVNIFLYTQIKLFTIMSNISKRERYKLPVAVFIILKNFNNQILLIKRSNTGWMDGFYSLPAGGLEEGEPINFAALRELEEEVAVKVDPKTLKIAHIIHSNINDERWLGYFFITDSWTGEPIVNEPEKHSEIKWVNLSELPENIIPYVKQALESKELYSNFGW
jgi:mutator protein MutT